MYSNSKKYQFLLFSTQLLAACYLCRIVQGFFVVAIGKCYIIFRLYANERLLLDSISSFTYQEVSRDSFISTKKYKNAFDGMLQTGTRRKDIECV